MSDWVVVPSLLSLRAEFNAISPGRDKGADGTIGDTSHTSSSDHTPDEDSSVLRDHDADGKSEVHALDIDSSGPWPRPFAQLVADVVEGERGKWLDADDVCRLEYVIFNRKIYSRSRDFRPIDYTGSDPHTNHAHFSARYLTQSENDTRPWGVEGDELSAAEVKDIKAAIGEAVSVLNTQINQVAAETLNAKVGGEVVPTRMVKQVLGDLGNGVRPALMFAPSHPEAKEAGVQAGSPIAILMGLAGLPNALSAINVTLKGLDLRLSQVEAKLNAE